MSRLTYNNVRLDLVETRVIDRTTVFDPTGLDYLYTRWVFNISGVFSPAWPGTQRASALLTDVAVRAALMSPRQPLVFEAPAHDAPGTLRTLLASPLPGDTSDAKGGPHPVFCHVEEVDGGDLTFLVNYGVVTNVRECDQPDVSFLVSNRWSSSYESDEDFYLTCVTRGRAVFDLVGLDRLLRATGSGAMPDEWRQQCFFPVRFGFQREDFGVEQSADGTTLDYYSVDREMGYNFDADTAAEKGVGQPVRSNATRVRLIHQKEYSDDLDLVGGLQTFLGLAANLSIVKGGKKKGGAVKNPLAGMMFPKGP